MEELYLLKKKIPSIIVVLFFLNPLLLAHPVQVKPIYNPIAFYESNNLKTPKINKKSIAISDNKNVPITEYYNYLVYNKGFNNDIRTTYLAYNITKRIIKKYKITINEDEKKRYFSINWADYVTFIKRQPYLLFPYYTTTSNFSVLSNRLYRKAKNEFELLYKFSATLAFLNKKPISNYTRLSRNNKFILIQEIISKYKTDKDIINYSPSVYGKWIFHNFHTTMLLENFLASKLFIDKAKEKNITPTIKTLKQSLNPGYYYMFKNYNDDLSLKDNSNPANLPQIKELISDYCGSYLMNYNKKFPEYIIKNKYYKTYGYKGQRIKVRHIFIWIRPKKKSRKDPSYPKLLNYYQTSAIKKLTEIKSKLESNGIENFSDYALLYSDDRMSREKGGIILNSFFDRFSPSFFQYCTNLGEKKITGPYQSSNGYHLIYRYHSTNGFKIAHIYKAIPNNNLKDLFERNNLRNNAKKKLITIQEELKNGLSFSNAIKKYSQFFSPKTMGDISADWPERYGWSFGDKLNKIKKGDTGIIFSERGAHLVIIDDKQFFPYSTQIKEKTVKLLRQKFVSKNELSLFALKILERNRVYYHYTPVLPTIFR